MHGPQSYRDGSADLVFELVDVVLEDVSEGFVRHFQFPWRAQPLFRGWTWEVVRGGGVVPVDSQGRPVKNEVHVWHGKWANDAGDVIAYDLTATTLENGGRSHVSGYARYLTPRK